MSTFQPLKNTAKRRLGQSDLHVHPICLGTMTFGEQVNEKDSHAIMARSLERGVDFMDTAEMYPVPPTAEKYTHTETIIGNYFKANPGVRQKWIVATKVGGPGRGMKWLRGGGNDVSPSDMKSACEASLKRLQTDVIDLYQLHWPVRPVPAFGNVYFDPKAESAMGTLTPIDDQLRALSDLVKEGKIRTIGLSNETPHGVSAFMAAAKDHGLERIVSVQNPYCLTNRVVDNGLDEVMHYHQVSLLAYSPLAFGVLTGKYDDWAGFTDSNGKGSGRTGRMALYERFQQQRWGRSEHLHAARRYNALAKANGLTPTQLALAFCYQSWRVASTIIGVTSLAQLDECLDAWNTPELSKELLAEIDKIRWEMKDPAI
jgi:aryl-alcohol dehydrogenase-like predicted oxidoreductase